MAVRIDGHVAPHELTAPSAYVGIGAVVPSDMALDDEYWAWSPERVVWYFTRTPPPETGAGPQQAEDFSEPGVVRAAVREVASSSPSAVAFGCTSGSFVHGLAGERSLRATMIEAGAPKAVTTSGAIVEALAALGVSRPAVVTPYDDETALKLVGFLGECGYTVPAYSFMGLDTDVDKIPYAATRSLVSRVDEVGGADSIVISCTNLRTFDLVAELEQKLDKPVVTANQATVWSALRAAQVSPPSRGQRLFP